MTEPQQESTEPTFEAVATPEPEPVEEEQQPIPFAPGFIAASPIPFTTDLDVQWMDPGEGPADSFVLALQLEDGTEASQEFPAGTYRALIKGLVADSLVTARITSTTGENEGTLVCPTVRISMPETAPEDTAPPADETPQEG